MIWGSKYFNLNGYWHLNLIDKSTGKGAFTFSFELGLEDFTSFELLRLESRILLEA